jgi:glycine/D-amino acid oxidase-like deaminating enzyme
MIALFRLVLTKNEIYIKKKFEYSDIVFYEDYVEWNGIKAKKIIFCEGSQATSNPYFKWLPFVLTKGELLSVKMEGMTVESIINKGVFIMPTANGLHKVGATNLWDFKDNEISSSAKLELTQKLDLITKVPYKVILQETGIRPTVKDRRPLIGLHPEIKTLGIFNGLGTKGVSLAPFYATMFCNFLEKGEDLDREVNIERYIPLYYTL